jgi:hypothetical protein
MIYWHAEQPPRRPDGHIVTTGNDGSRRHTLLVGAAVGLMVAAGAVAALANFAGLPLAVGLGAGSGAAGFAGPLLWERRTARRDLHQAWAHVVDAGPASDPVAAPDSLLALLNPDRRIVPFDRRRAQQLRPLLTWCTQRQGGSVWLLAGAAGDGKTRLLVEAARRLADADWICGWVRQGCESAVVDVAVQWDRPVLLIVDDADTRPDLLTLLTAVSRRRDDQVRVVVAAREFSEWWTRLREQAPREIAAGFPAGRTDLPPLISDLHGQQQNFTIALRAFAQDRQVALPAATLTPTPAPLPVVLIHAAAAVTVAGSLTGTIDLDIALQQLFDLEEAWWQQRAADSRRYGNLRTLGLPALQDTVVLAVLLGADDLDDAAGRLRHLPGLGATNDTTRQTLATWIRELYPQRAGDWLSPHLPARLVERYVAARLAARPSLVAAIAAAALPAPGGTP